MTPQTLLTLSKLAALIGGVLAALGGFGSWYFFMKIKNTAPDLVIESLTPVMIYKYKEVDLGSEEKFKYMDKGVSFVIHMKSKANPISISRLKLKGRIFISFNRYIAQGEHAGRNINELNQEWLEKKPYINVNWTAFIDQNKSVSSLTAFDDRVISFTLVDPIVSGQAESGWRVPFSDYLGYIDGSKEPKRQRTHPEIGFIFKTEVGHDLPFDIKDEIKNGDLQFVLVAGTKEFKIPYKNFKKFKFFNKKYWDNSPIEKIIFRSH